MSPVPLLMNVDNEFTICEDAGRGWLLGSNFIDIGAIRLNLAATSRQNITFSYISHIHFRKDSITVPAVEIASQECFSPLQQTCYGFLQLLDLRFRCSTDTASNSQQSLLLLQLFERKAPP